MLNGAALLRERFLILVCDGVTARDAWLQTHPKCRFVAAADAAASRVLSSAKAQQRLAQLQAERAAALQISVPFLTGRLLKIAAQSEALGQGSAAVQAMMGIAKMHGFLVERHEVDARVRRPSASPESPDEMSEVEWLKTHGLITVIDHDSTEAILSEPAEVVSSSSDEDTTDMLTPTDKSPLEGSGSG